MRLPYSIQGSLFAPALVFLIFILKAFCTGSGGSCFPDYFASIIFLPVVAMYRMFGRVPELNFPEVCLIFLYWAFIGFLIGFFVDLLKPRSEDVPMVGGKKPI